MKTLSRFFIRLRYPVSTPEEIADALGIPFSNWTPLRRIVKCLTCPYCKPCRLYKYMSRTEAEAAFFRAPQKELFSNSSLFSYQFNEGWLEFKLHFDQDNRLRRVFIQHPSIQSPAGSELPLPKRHHHASSTSLSNHSSS